MADPVVTLEQVKPQLKLEADEHEQDAHVQRLIVSAQAAVETYISRDIAMTWPTGTEPQRIVANQAVALIVEEWFLRGAEGTIPQGVIWLLRRIRTPRI